MTHPPSTPPRTLADYRPQHDEDCEVHHCGHRGCKAGVDTPIWHMQSADHKPFPKPCSCGLSALLMPVTPKEEKDHGGTSLTEGAGVSVSVPAPQLSHADALLAFARWALDGYITDENRIGDLDGRALEEKALELGLLRDCGEGYAAAKWLEEAPILDTAGTARPNTKAEAADQLEAAYQRVPYGIPVTISEVLVWNILGHLRSFPVGSATGSSHAERADATGRSAAQETDTAHLPVTPPCAVCGRAESDWTHNFIGTAVAHEFQPVTPPPEANIDQLRAKVARYLRLVILGVEGWGHNELVEAQAIYDETQRHLVDAASAVTPPQTTPKPVSGPDGWIHICPDCRGRGTAAGAEMFNGCPRCHSKGTLITQSETPPQTTANLSEEDDHATRAKAGIEPATPPRVDEAPLPSEIQGRLGVDTSTSVRASSRVIISHSTPQTTDKGGQE